MQPSPIFKDLKQVRDGDMKLTKSWLLKEETSEIW